jgi:DNA-binding response OmpR family regulator
VVDDDEQIRSMLRRVLSAEGYDIELAATATEARAALAKVAPDLVLLDINLPDDDGRDLLATVRETSEIPIVLLTGLGNEADRILGLKLGADDYVVKPFSHGELVARIATILRRSRNDPAATKASLRFGDLELDTAAREVRLRGDLVDMTAREFDLLVFLASSPRQVFSREQLLDHVWGSSSEWQDDATVTEHIRRLRRHIEDEPLKPKRLVTVRGAGYRFEP